MNADLLAALPLPIVHAVEAEQPVTLGGVLVGSLSTSSNAAPDTPQSGPGAIRRWIALFDRATWLMSEPDPNDPCSQRTASKAIDSLFSYEHLLTPLARRQAREVLWQRDRTEEPLPTTPHAADESRPVACHCPVCRVEWEQCRCRICRLNRLLHRPVSS